jgi:hypothetical protein
MLKSHLTTGNKMEHSENFTELAKALNTFQAGLGSVAKSSQGYNYSYADLTTVWDALRQPLTSNGLTVMQNAFNTEEGVSVQTMLIHTSGQWIKTGVLTVPCAKKDAQSSGSAITYAKRYQLSALLGIVTDADDDGAKAMEKPKAQQAVSKINDYQKKTLNDLMKKLPEDRVAKVKDFVKDSGFDSVVNISPDFYNKLHKMLIKCIEELNKSEFEEALPY